MELFLVPGRIRGRRAICTQPDIYMSTHKENRFIREVEAATRENPNVDMDLIRECQKIAEMLEKLPPLPAESSEKEQPRLQPIPLNLFNQWT